MKPTREEIEARAYQLWVDGGRCHGYHLEHWLQAEAALIAARAVTMATPGVSATPAPAARKKAPVNNGVAKAEPVAAPAPVVTPVPPTPSKTPVKSAAASAEPLAAPAAKRSVTPATPKPRATRTTKR